MSENVLKHKKPCNDCPFRKKAPAGWLGANHPQPFVNAAQNTGLPCHKTVDYEAEDWDVEQNYAPACAGSLIMMKNAGMRPYDPDVQDMVDAVEKSDDVFAWPFEFVKHHTEASVRSWEFDL